MGIQKVKPVDEHGMYLYPNLKIWKEKNPNKLWFHSPFEQRCWLKLKKTKLDFTTQPTAIEMIPEFKTLGFSKNKVCTMKVQDAVYTPDLLINTKLGKLYIELKGFFRPADRIRFKLLQYTLLRDSGSFILLIKSDIEFDKLLTFINAEFNLEKSKTLIL